MVATGRIPIKPDCIFASDFDPSIGIPCKLYNWCDMWEYPDRCADYKQKEKDTDVESRGSSGPGNRNI